MEQTGELNLEALVKWDRRRSLIPVWIKIFIWLFIIMGAFVLVGFTAAIFGLNFQLALFGLESNDPLSAVGLVISFLFILKGVAAVSLWTEQDWAIHLALVDAIIGIIVCCIVMLVLPFLMPDAGFSSSIRLELALLIPYYLKLKKIKRLW